ncbi:fungal-specific transcription factor domain-containing protein [Xylariales sp. PMI_506]|nr:fungal-specific transcription factor domain-containing protein [Xylariales sp. PMI_506]
MQGKACGTCRARKLLCDLSRPACQRCTKSNLECRGYGLRLSWPKTNHSKRALVAKPSSSASRVVSQYSSVWLINVSTWDMAMNDYLTGLGSKDRHCLAPPIMPQSLPWAPIKLKSGESELLQYFQLVDSASLATYGQDPQEFRKILLRMATSNGAPSTIAVMKSLLAFSSMHRFGPHIETTKFKLAAIRSLSTSLSHSMEKYEAMQHIAAGMLLCLLEAQEDTSGPNMWILYLVGVKEILRATRLSQRLCDDPTFIALIYWVHYHDALSAFSALLWRRYGSFEQAYVKDLGESHIRSRVANCARSKIPGMMSPPHEVIYVLMKACDLFRKPFYLRDKNDLRMQTIQAYHRDLAKLPALDICKVPVAVDFGTREADAIDIELHRLATSVFLSRSTGGLRDGGGACQWTYITFLLFPRLNTYDRAFPLLIFGLEAQTDLQRTVVLDLIARTLAKSTTTRNLQFVKSIIQASWVQDELSAGGVEYMDKVTVLISSCQHLPTFI